MTASDLEQLLIDRLVRDNGSTSQTWQRALGMMIVSDTKTHAHCNWDFRLSGTDAERSAIERLLDDVRLEQPIVKAGGNARSLPITALCEIEIALRPAGGRRLFVVTADDERTSVRKVGVLYRSNFRENRPSWLIIGVK